MGRRTQVRLAGWVTAIGLTTVSSIALVTASVRPVDSDGPDGPALERTRGTLQRIDARERLLSIDSEDLVVDIRLDDATTIFVGGRSAGLNELRVGEEVCATWEPGPPLPTAQWVEPCAD